MRAAAVLVQATTDALSAVDPDLTMTDLRILGLLSREEPKRLIDLAAALDVTATSVTRFADRLSGAGLVDRIRVPGDRREIHLAVTDKGRSVVDDVFERRRQFVAVRLRGASSMECDSGLRLLERISSSDLNEGLEALDLSG